MDPPVSRSGGTPAEAGRISTFIVVDGGRGAASSLLSGSSRCSAVTAGVMPPRRRVNSDGSTILGRYRGRNEALIAASAGAGCSVAAMMKRHSLDDRRPPDARRYSLSSHQQQQQQQQQLAAAVNTQCPDGLSHPSRHSVLHSSSSYPMEQQQQQQFGADSSSRPTRRRSLYDSPATSGGAILHSAANFRSAMMAAAQSGNRASTGIAPRVAGSRRSSDTKLSPTVEGEELFRERSLTDCNRAARMRVMARLVLRSPVPPPPRVTETPSSRVTMTAWDGAERGALTPRSPPPRRRLEPLRCPIANEHGSDVAVNDDDDVIWKGRRESSVDRTGNHSTTMADVESVRRTTTIVAEVQRGCGREERGGDWLSKEDGGCVMVCSLAPRQQTTTNDRPTVTSRQSPAAMAGGCKPKPLIGRRGREVLMFGSESQA